MFEKYLQVIGLSDKEAAVYLALLQVDHAPVITLAEKTKIKRPTVYITLESLAKKGLVSQTQIGKKTHYQAEPPERLETFVERQKVVLEEHSRRLKDIIPQIKSIQREGGERPVVKFFEGRDGAVSAYEEFYSENSGTTVKDGYFVYPRDLLLRIFTNEESKKFRELRKKKDIFAHSIYTDAGEGMSDDKDSRRVRLDRGKYPLACDIGIIGDTVVITTLGERVSSLFIKSKDIAETLVSLIKKIHEAK